MSNEAPIELGRWHRNWLDGICFSLVELATPQILWSAPQSCRMIGIISFTDEDGYFPQKLAINRMSLSTPVGRNHLSLYSEMTNTRFEQLSFKGKDLLNLLNHLSSPRFLVESSLLIVLCLSLVLYLSHAPSYSCSKDFCVCGLFSLFLVLQFSFNFCCSIFKDQEHQ